MRHFTHQITSDALIEPDEEADLPALASEPDEYTTGGLRDAAATGAVALEVLSTDQRAVLNILCGPVWPTQVLALLGAAGTGKSTVLQTFLDQCRSLKIVKVAPTGIAAQNIGGITLHSLLKLPPELQTLDGNTITVFDPGSPEYQVLQALDILVIDEISMVRVDLMDAVDRALRENCGLQQPFGGKRVLLVGDLLQLEPVIGNSRDESEYIRRNWKSHFFFDARVWSECEITPLLLTQIHRQEHRSAFAAALNGLRRKDGASLRFFNERRIERSEVDALVLVTRRRDAEAVNSVALRAIRADLHVFRAFVAGEVQKAPAQLPAAKNLMLKLGARVLLLVNAEGYRNGSRGEIIGVFEDCVRVRLESGDVVYVPPYVWPQYELRYDRERNEIIRVEIGRYIQLPIQLGWAVTIHKSQGMTLDRVTVDFGRGAFAHGQVYVALSRVRTLDGLFLKRPVYPSDLVVHSRVVKFLETIERSSRWGRRGPSIEAPACARAS